MASVHIVTGTCLTPGEQSLLGLLCEPDLEGKAAKQSD